ncbi:MAG: DUF4267 domain-containing protein [Candidatus Eremiobacteraeota bacterium]|nr:DUF4267 domain-containing protein [Candidatus Eremiobacteraeota bacterium]
MVIIGTVLSIAVGLMFILIGTAALAQPAILSHLYGLYVHERNGRGFVRATGARDVAFGVLIIAFVFLYPGALVVTLGVGACLGLADLLIVWSGNGRFEPLLWTHVIGFLGVALIATIVGIGNLSR